MMENEKTILTIEHNNMKFISEMPWDAGMDDMLDVFYGLCVSATFAPKTILSHMKEFAEEKLEAYWPNEYGVEEIDD